MDGKAWKMSVLRMALIIVGMVVARTEAESFADADPAAEQDIMEIIGALEPDVQPVINTEDGEVEDITSGNKVEEGLSLLTPEEGLTLLTRGDTVEGLTLVIPGDGVELGLTLLTRGDKVEESLKILLPGEADELGHTLLTSVDLAEENLISEDKEEESLIPGVIVVGGEGHVGDVSDESELEEDGSVRTARRKVKGPRRWPNATITYLLVGKESVQRRVMDVFAGLENSTCLKFITRTGEEPYMLINVGAGKCWTSSVGYPRSKVTVNLGPGCRYRSRITHEVLHAAGFLHEHTRPDRDQYVTVNWDNIRPGTQRNFMTSRRYPTLEVPYDYQSVMHYGDYAFAVNRSTPTLVRLQGGTKKMGGTRLTHLDILRINTFYRCHLSPPPSP